VRQTWNNFVMADQNKNPVRDLDECRHIELLTRFVRTKNVSGDDAKNVASWIS
jgi:hypothetical protein